MPLANRNKPRRTTQLVSLSANLTLVPVSLYLAFGAQYGEVLPLPVLETAWILFPVVIVYGCMLISAFELHLENHTAFGTRIFFKAGMVACLLTLITMALSHIMMLPSPRSIPLLFGTIYFLIAMLTRVFLKSPLAKLVDRSRHKAPVAIYGAGAAGTRLAAELQRSNLKQPVFFVDDNPNLNGLVILGLPIHNPDRLKILVRKHKVQQILVAIPSASKGRLNYLINELSALPAEARYVSPNADAGCGKDAIKNDSFVTLSTCLAKESATSKHLEYLETT